MSAFDSIADHYEMLSGGDNRLAREGPFLADCLRRAPGLRVADIACGAGLHAKFFADLGAQVTAIDLSPQMIAYAGRQRPHSSIAYAVGDMRCLVGGPWDLIVCLGNSLSLLNSLEDVKTTLEGIAWRLSERGLFVLQVLNYAAVANQQPRHRVEKKTSDDEDVIAVKSLVPHETRTLLSVTFHFMHGGKHTAVSETAALLHLSLEHLRDCAEYSGLVLEAVYGGFDRSDYSPEKSPDLIAVLRKVQGSA